VAPVAGVTPVHSAIASSAHRAHRTTASYWPFDEEIRFTGLSRAKRKTVRNAGKKAISAAINNCGFETTPDDFNDLVAALNDITFKERLTTLSKYATEAVPGVVEDFDDWPKLVASVRNYLAHWLLEEDVTEVPSTDQRLLVFLSLPWVLRTVLLHRAKLDHDIMREGYTESGEYPLYIAYVRSILASS